MKHTARNIKAFFGFLLVFFLFASCTDLLNNSKETKAKVCKVSGTLLADGSVPARSASASFPSNLVWSVSATNGTDTQEATVDGLNYSITLEQGTWDFTITGKKAVGTLLFTGSKEFEISEDTEIEIPLTFAFEEKSGAIALTINDATNSVKTLLCELKNSEGTSLEISSTFTNGTASLEKSNLAPDTYEATITFYSADDTVLYSCNEIITVFPQLTTDTWMGSSAYISNGVFNLTNKNLQAFAKTKRETPYVLWNRKGFDMTNVQDHSGGLALEYVNKYKSGLEIVYQVDDSTSVTRPIFTAEIYKWCFDDEDSLYSVEGNFERDDEDETDNGTYSIIVSKYELVNKGYYTDYEKVSVPLVVDVMRSAVFLDTACIHSISWTSYLGHEYLYLLYYQTTQGESQYNYTPVLKVYDITNWDKTNSITSAAITNESLSWGEANITYTIQPDSESSYLVADGNKLYLAFAMPSDTSSNSSKYLYDKMYLMSFKLNPDTPGLARDEESSVVDITPTTLIEGLYDSVRNSDGSYYSASYYIPDMRIIDGKLYILYSLLGSTRSDADSSSNYVIFYHINGGIVKVNLSGGLSSSAIETWADGSKILGWYSEMKDIQKRNSDYGYTTHNVKMTLPAPASELDHCFMNPRKIVAIKPDELVIADDGWEYEENSSDHMKNHDRLVTVSLNTWAITDSKDINCMFDGYSARIGTGTAYYGIRVKN